MLKIYIERRGLLFTAAGYGLVVDWLLDNDFHLRCPGRERLDKQAAVSISAVIWAGM